MVKINLKYLNEFSEFLNGIELDLYIKPASKHSFSGTIGAHTRHVIEFYQEFFNSSNKKSINYDERKRNLKIETNKVLALECLESIRNEFSRILFDENQMVVTIINGQKSNTSIGREISYLSEHTIHHFALMRLIAESEGYNFNSFPDFGIAQSTSIYRLSQIG